jgi:hypothetical protein
MDIKSLLTYTEETLEIVEKLYFSASGEQKRDLQKAMANLVMAREELEKNYKPSGTRSKIENKDDVYIVSCYLSRFGHEDLYKDLNQTQAIQKVAEILGLKPTTLKGTRDIFDPFFDNGRKGWSKRQLNETEQKLFEKYKKESKEKFLAEVKQILRM